MIDTTVILLLLPWLLLGGALVALLVLVGFWRRHAAIAALATAAMLITGLLCLRMSHQLAAVPAAVAPDVLPLLALDGVGYLLAGVFALCGALIAALSWRYLNQRRGDAEEYYVLLMCAVFGAMTLVVADHFATVLMGLEILAISLYALIAYPEEGHWPLEAGMKYLVLSGVASSTLLFGVALLYASTGSLGFDALTGAGVVAADDPLLLTGAAMLVAAMAFKLSLVPFHLWTPDVYQGAPAPVAGFVSTVSKGAVVVVLLRIELEAQLLAQPPMQLGLIAIALLSMLIGNLLAVQQQSVKRILAYSSIAHMGYLMVALIAIDRIAGTGIAIEATVVYVIAYTLMTLAAFGVVAAMTPVGAERDIDLVADFRGLIWRRPLAATVMSVALLSLAGIPLTMGFVGKFYLVAAGVERSLWLLLWVLVVGSGIGLFYYLRILFSMIRDVDPDTPQPGESGIEGGWALGIVALALVVLGLWPAPLIELVQQALRNI